MCTHATSEKWNTTTKMTLAFVNAAFCLERQLARTILLCLEVDLHALRVLSSLLSADNSTSRLRMRIFIHCNWFGAVLPSGEYERKIHVLRNLHVRRMTAVSLIAAFVNLRTVCESELKSGPKFNVFITVTPSVRKHIEISCRLNTFQRRLKTHYVWSVSATWRRCGIFLRLWRRR